MIETMLPGYERKEGIIPWSVTDLLRPCGLRVLSPKCVLEEEEVDDIVMRSVFTKFQKFFVHLSLEYHISDFFGVHPILFKHVYVRHYSIVKDQFSNSRL